MPTAIPSLKTSVPPIRTDFKYMSCNRCGTAGRTPLEWSEKRSHIDAIVASPHILQNEGSVSLDRAAAL